MMFALPLGRAMLKVNLMLASARIAAAYVGLPARGPPTAINTYATNFCSVLARVTLKSEPAASFPLLALAPPCHLGSGGANAKI